MAKDKKRNRDQQHADEQVIDTPAEQTTSEPSTVEPPTGELTEVTVQNNFATVGDKIETAGGEIAPQPEPVTTKNRGVIPDQFGNNVKGERICSECGVKESETLAKNPRYSFCKGKCVNCYGKTERKVTKPGDLTIEQIEEKLAFYQGLLKIKLGAQGQPEGNAIENAETNTAAIPIESLGASVGTQEDPTQQLASIE
jgi:hypothetical protein